MLTPAGNLFDSNPAPSGQEHIFALLRSDAVRIERIVSQGQASPEGFWYDQAANEWVALLKGTAVLSFAGGEKMELNAGDFLLIPAHAKHRVESTSADATWLAIHYS